LDVDRVRTPAVQNGLQFRRDQLDSFIQRYSLEPPFTAPADSLQGIREPLGVIKESSERPAFQAPAQLWPLLCVRQVIVRDAEDLASTNVSLEMASSPAIVIAEHGCNPKFCFLDRNRSNVGRWFTILIEAHWKVSPLTCLKTILLLKRGGALTKEEKLDGLDESSDIPRHT
jgi:hypothetical protein